MITDSTAHEVIPQGVVLKGTVRTMDLAVQDVVERRVREIAEGTAQALGGRAEVNDERGYPLTVNAGANTGFAAEVVRGIGARVDTDTPPLMGAEDFSFMRLERPGACIFVGNGDTAMVRHPAYDFDDAVIPNGSSWYAGVSVPRVDSLR